MCQFKSALLLKNRVFVPDYDRHSDMLDELGIEDNMLNASKTFVRLELSPENFNISSDPMTWKLKVDQDIVPDWFQPEFDELRVKEAVKDWWKEHVFAEGQHVVRDGIYYAYGSSTVEACDSSTVEAYGSSTVRACDSSTVEAYGSSTVVLPLYFQTTGVIGLSENAICINHKKRTFRSCSAWKMEVGK